MLDFGQVLPTLPRIGLKNSAPTSGRDLSFQYFGNSQPNLVSGYS